MDTADLKSLRAIIDGWWVDLVMKSWRVDLVEDAEARAALFDTLARRIRHEILGKFIHDRFIPCREGRCEACPGIMSRTDNRHHICTCPCHPVDDLETKADFENGRRDERERAYAALCERCAGGQPAVRVKEGSASEFVHTGKKGEPDSGCGATRLRMALDGKKA